MPKHGGWRFTDSRLVQYLMPPLLTRMARLLIIRVSSFAPLFGPSLRRALTFPGIVGPSGHRSTRGARDVPSERLRRKRMPCKESDVLLPVNVARCAKFVYTASRQGECYGKEEAPQRR